MKNTCLEIKICVIGFQLKARPESESAYSKEYVLYKTYVQVGIENAEEPHTTVF